MSRKKKKKISLILVHIFATWGWIGGEMTVILSWMLIQAVFPFDPFPFILLALALGIFTLFLDNVILIANEHQNEIQDKTMNLLINMGKSQLQQMEAQKKILEYILECEQEQIEFMNSELSETSCPPENL